MIIPSRRGQRFVRQFSHQSSSCTKARVSASLRIQALGLMKAMKKNKDREDPFATILEASTPITTHHQILGSPFLEGHGEPAAQKGG